MLELIALAAIPAAVRVVQESRRDRKARIEHQVKERARYASAKAQLHRHVLDTAQALRQ